MYHYRDVWDPEINKIFQLRTIPVLIAGGMASFTECVRLLSPSFGWLLTRLPGFFIGFPTVILALFPADPWLQGASLLPGFRIKGS